MRLSRLLELDVTRTGDAKPLGRVDDALIAVGEGRVVYVLASPGVREAPLVLSADRLTVSEEGIEARADDAELRALRAGPAPGTRPDAPLDLTGMPPLVIGPFGNTIAPAMGAALVNATAARDRNVRPALDRAHADWYWYDTLGGLAVFGESGEIGMLEDIVVDPDGLICRSLSVRDGAGDLYNLPFDAIRHVSKGETHIVVQTSPKPPHAPEWVSGPRG